MTKKAVPETLWHLTTAEAGESIKDEGFTAPMGNYFCAELNNCARFLAFRPIEEPMVAIQISTEGLNVEESFDHSEAIFGDDSWVVWGEVSPASILLITGVVIERRRATA